MVYGMSVVTICEKLPFLGDVVGKREKLNNMKYLSQTGFVVSTPSLWHDESITVASLKL